MRKYLSHDAESGKLRLVYDDYWQGNHERTEYMVMDARAGGDPVRHRADLDGTPVHGLVPSLYIKGPHGQQALIWAEEVPLGPVVKTPCPRASNARRKCSLCADQAA